MKRSWWVMCLALGLSSSLPAANLLKAKGLVATKVLAAALSEYAKSHTTEVSRQAGRLAVRDAKGTIRLACATKDASCEFDRGLSDGRGLDAINLVVFKALLALHETKSAGHKDLVLTSNLGVRQAVNRTWIVVSDLYALPWDRQSRIECNASPDAKTGFSGASCRYEIPVVESKGKDALELYEAVKAESYYGDRLKGLEANRDLKLGEVTHTEVLSGLWKGDAQLTVNFGAVPGATPQDGDLAGVIVHLQLLRVGKIWQVQGVTEHPNFFFAREPR